MRLCQDAERSLVAAIRYARDLNPTDLSEAVRQRRIVRDLERAAMAVSSVGSLTPRMNLSEPESEQPPARKRKADPSASGENV
jgi:hypothetical protein